MLLQEAMKKLDVTETENLPDKTELEESIQKLDSEIIALIDAKKDKFIEAMEDDLNTGEALGAIFELVKEINLNVNDGVQSKALVEYAISVFDELMNVLGLLYNRNAEKSLDDEIEALIQARNDARKAKNWAEADRIRDELKAQGIVLEDTPQGVKWHRA